MLAPFPPQSPQDVGRGDPTPPWLFPLPQGFSITGKDVYP